MTRNEYYERATTWYDLIEIATECDYDDELEDVVGDDHVRERIQYRANDINGGNDWENFAMWVSDIPQGYEYLSYDSDLDEFSGLTDRDFENRKEDLFSLLLENDFIEEEEEEEAFEDETESTFVDGELFADDEEESVPEEAFPIDKLISMCYADIKVIRDNR